MTVNSRAWDNPFPWKASKNDVSQLATVLSQLADIIPAREGGGARLRAFFKGSKKAKMATYCFWASPYGTYLVGHLTALKPAQRHTIQQLLCAMSFLSDDAIPIAEMPGLHQAIVKALCLIEQHLPCTELDIKLHNLIHLVDRIPDLGANWTTAMWGYESLWRYVNNLIKKRDTPETSAMFSWCHLEAALLISDDISMRLVFRDYLPNNDKDVSEGPIQRQHFALTFVNEGLPDVAVTSLPGMAGFNLPNLSNLSLIHISEPTRRS